MTEISCIIINYNTANLTFNAVQTLLNHNAQSSSIEIILVDNASNILDYQLLKRKINSLNSKNVSLVRSKVNLGFGGGNMYGLRHASNSKYFVFINSDTIHYQKGALKMIFDYMEIHQNVAICGPQMIDQQGNRRISFDHFPTISREIFKRYLLEKLFPGRYLDRKKKYSEPIKVDFVQGAFMFVRAPEFIQIGGFDTNIFLYYEESDVSLRFKRVLNLDTVFFPSVSYVHLVSQSTSKNINIKIEQKLSLLYHTEKHYGSKKRFVLLIYLIVRYAITLIAKFKYYKLLVFLFKGGQMSNSIKYK